MPEETISKALLDIREVSDWDFDDILKYALTLCMTSATQSISNYEICVRNLEALLLSDIEREKAKLEKDIKEGKNPSPHFDYWDLVKKKEEELKQRYRSPQEKDEFTKELTIFKFGLLLRLMKKRLPVGIELKL